MKKQITKRQTEAFYNHQILRLANIYLSKPVSKENNAFHLRVGRLQVAVIKAKRAALNAKNK